MFLVEPPITGIEVFVIRIGAMNSLMIRARGYTVLYYTYVCICTCSPLECSQVFFKLSVPFLHSFMHRICIVQVIFVFG